MSCKIGWFLKILYTLLKPAVSPSIQKITLPLEEINLITSFACSSVNEVPEAATTFSIPFSFKAITSNWPSTTYNSCFSLAVFLALSILKKTCFLWNIGFSELFIYLPALSFSDNFLPVNPIGFPI